MDILKMAAEVIGQKLGMDADRLMGAVQGLIGDGQNAPMSPDQVTGLLGEDKVAAFAAEAGVDTRTASTALSDALPGIIDKLSSGGSLLDGLGDARGLLGGLGKLF
jgi:uncharacterized protein YidB (DUF937 family)